jgi:predicted nucleotidyltransferase
MATQDSRGPYHAGVRRTDLIDALRVAIEPLDHVRAAWLGGSDASERTDDLSDVDLLVVAEDERVEDVLQTIEAAAAAVSPVSHRYRLPPPTWHGHEQVFYRFAGGGPHLLLDLLVMKLSAEERFLERERHGDPPVLVDRDGIVAPSPLDRVAHDERRAALLTDIRARFPIFQSFVLKSIERDQPTDAMQFYRMATLIPLVQLLRIRHCPDRFDFGLRYLDRDLPPDLKETIDRLSYAADMETLRLHQAEAADLFGRFADDATWDDA